MDVAQAALGDEVSPAYRADGGVTGSHFDGDVPRHVVDVDIPGLRAQAQAAAGSDLDIAHFDVDDALRRRLGARGGAGRMRIGVGQSRRAGAERLEFGVALSDADRRGPEFGASHLQVAQREVDVRVGGPAGDGQVDVHVVVPDDRGGHALAEQGAPAAVDHLEDAVHAADVGAVDGLGLSLHHPLDSVDSRIDDDRRVAQGVLDVEGEGPLAERIGAAAAPLDTGAGKCVPPLP